jgi:uncharacterized membrane protein
VLFFKVVEEVVNDTLGVIFKIASKVLLALAIVQLHDGYTVINDDLKCHKWSCKSISKSSFLNSQPSSGTLLPYPWHV